MRRRRPGSRARAGATAAAVLASALAACDAGFETPEIVLDLRILGITTTPPEVVVDVDPSAPGAIDVDDLGATEVCALVADPGSVRGLRYRLLACPPENDGRCGEETARLEVAAGTIADPERSASTDPPCATLAASAGLAAVLADSVRADDLAGFGNVAVMLSLAVWPEDADPAGAEYGSKRMRYAPRLPAERVANTNPTLDAVRVARAPSPARGDDFDLPAGRCGEIAGFPVAPGEQIQLVPRESATAREPYVVPTFDGGARRLTEVLSYQYYATAGSWSRFQTGGPRDAAGNVPPIDSRWTAPDDAEVIGDGLSVALWIVVRDERGGQAWVESCARVVP